jgi:hypothetical protein
MGKKASIPDEIKGWNWGAFFLNWIWGIGNSTYIALLTFIPLFGLVVPFVLGAKGNKWAWQNRAWRDVEHFKRTQRKWAISGLILFLVVFPALYFLITGSMKHSDAYKLSLSELQNNSELIELIGQPIEPGFFVTGNISSGSGSGKALLNYSIKGPSGAAKAQVYAIKEIDGWHIKELLVFSEEQQELLTVITSEE